MGYCPKYVLTKGLGRRWAGRTGRAAGAGTHAAGAGTRAAWTQASARLKALECAGRTGVRGRSGTGAQTDARLQASADTRASRQGRAGSAACAYRLGQVGALCTWLSFDSVFDPVLTQYYS